ncbi:MAG: SCO family protein, partial [Pseudomonadota bacterium]
MSNNKTSEQQKGIRNTVLFMLGMVVFVAFSLWYKMQQPVLIGDGALKAYGVYLFDTPRLVKPFTLVDKNAKPYSKSNLEGKWTFVFYGFTNCPDICPVTLSLFKSIQEQLDGTEVSGDTRFMMVSLDPARDTPEKMKEYVEHFNPSFEGITGEFLALHAFATNVNVAFQKVLQKDDYTIDHSGNIVLLNDKGDYQGFIRPPFDAKKIV